MIELSTPTRKLLRMEQVAQRLEISISKAYRLAQQGDLRCLRIGRAIRVQESDLDAWIASHLMV